MNEFNNRSTILYEKHYKTLLNDVIQEPRERKKHTSFMKYIPNSYAGMLPSKNVIDP